MTKFLTKAALAATVATGLFAAPAFAAPAGNEDFTARARIVKPVTIANLTDLDFGTVTMNTSIVSEVVNVGNGATDTAVCGSAQLTCSGASGSADFTLSGGVANQAVALSYNAAPTVLTHSNGTNTVPFRLNSIANVTLDPTGAGEFSVGGRITVATATVDGDYSAVVNVVANYL